jgi:hypothetical protein
MQYLKCSRKKVKRKERERERERQRERERERERLLFLSSPSLLFGDGILSFFLTFSL